MLRNMASSLFLTERPSIGDEATAQVVDPNRPKVSGRIITTVPKAKEVRALVEKSITIAKRARPHLDAAARLGTQAKRGSSEWKAWREGPQYRQWNEAMAPALAARRRALRLLGDKQAVRVLFDVVAPRFATRPGGYTRILRLAKPRLGDAGPRAILEFVGRNDRVSAVAQKPAFGGAS
jgi:large subunit ribosomal protein L17